MATIKRESVEHIQQAIDEVLALLEEGRPCHEAIKVAKVHHRTWYKWLTDIEGLRERYKEALEKGKPIRIGAMESAAESGLVDRLRGYVVKETTRTTHPDGSQTVVERERYIEPNAGVNFRVLQGIAPETWGQAQDQNHQAATVVNIIAPDGTVISSSKVDASNG